MGLRCAWKYTVVGVTARREVTLQSPSVSWVSVVSEPVHVIRYRWLCLSSCRNTKSNVPSSEDRNFMSSDTLKEIVELTAFLISFTNVIMPSLSSQLNGE